MDEALDLRMPQCKGHDIEEGSIRQLQQLLTDGAFKAIDLTNCYLERIKRLNSRLRAVIEVNPDAIEIASRSDDERSRGVVRGPLHGIPFLVKDNIATDDKMETTAGSSMLIGARVPEDAAVVKRLREAGAILLGHANMSEWASMRATYYAEGYSSRGGQSRNPYNLAEHAGGSSSGSAIAVTTNMCAFSLGTETDSSVILPAGRNGIVGIKPTVGLVSCEGVIPESRNLDTVGTFGRTVADAALAFDAICGQESNFASHLSTRKMLKGARFGLPWKRIWEKASIEPQMKLQYETLTNIVNLIEAAGAHVYRNADLPSCEERIPIGGGWGWDYPATQGHPEQSEFTVVKVDFYNDIKGYLASLTTNPNNIYSVEDIVEYNKTNTETEGGQPGTHPAWPTGQDNFVKSAHSKGVEDDTYRSALSFIQLKSGKEGIDAALAHEGGQLDGLLVPTQADDGVANQITAQAGYPMITIPVGIDSNGIPFGLSIIQTAHGEDKLIQFGSAIEDLLNGRPKPQFSNIDAKDWLYIGAPPEVPALD